MKRAIKAEIIVESGENSLACLTEAVCEYFESKGFKTAIPHVYPEDPVVIECVDVIPNLFNI